MRWSITQTVQPVSEPVSIGEAKRQARIDADILDEDALIQANIKAVRLALETETGRQFMSSTWVYRCDAFPCVDWFVLPRPPLVSVTSLQYVDTAGATQTWDASNYTVDPYDTPGKVYLAYNKTWPSPRAVPNAVTLTYVAGYGPDPEDVPEPLRIAILLWQAELYAHREATTQREMVKLPYAVERLIAPYRTAAVLVGRD